MKRLYKVVFQAPLQKEQWNRSNFSLVLTSTIPLVASHKWVLSLASAALFSYMLCKSESYFGFSETGSDFKSVGLKAGRRSH